MSEYQFAREKIDKAETKAIEAFQKGNGAEFDRQVRIRSFWIQQLNGIMEVQVYEE